MGSNHKYVHRIFKHKEKQEELKKLIESLVKEGSKTTLNLTAHLITGKLYKKYPKFTVEIIGELAEYKDWEIREEAATVLKRLKQKYFALLYPSLKLWAEGKNPFLKRAICVSLIQTFKDEEKNLEKIFYLWERVIQCEDSYVKKNCGPFGLAAIFRRYPKQTETKLYEWVEKYADNPTVIWNIIAVFSQANAKYFPQEGERVLTKIEHAGLIKKHPQLKRIFISVKKKLRFARGDKSSK